MAAQPIVLILDREPFLGEALAGELRAGDFLALICGSNAPEAAQAAARVQPDIILFDFHSDRPDDLMACSPAQLAAPAAAMVALASVGPAARHVRSWNEANGRCLHRVLEKPLTRGALVTALRDLMAARRAAQALDERTHQLTSLIPQGAVSALEEAVAGQGQLLEAAIVFTDVRRSSELATRLAPREFFDLLNRTLSEQSALVRAGGGAVVKYTGDGMMATFRGMGRAYLALRCATALSEMGARAALPFGVGVAEGLVLAGFVGDAASEGHLRQYDVLGATVHLAARLCSLAEAGQVVTTQHVLSASRTSLPFRALGPVQVKGFGTPIDCVAMQHGSALPTN